MHDVSLVITLSAELRKTRRDEVVLGGTRRTPDRPEALSHKDVPALDDTAHLAGGRSSSPHSDTHFGIRDRRGFHGHEVLCRPVGELQTEARRAIGRLRRLRDQVIGIELERSRRPSRGAGGCGVILVAVASAVTSPSPCPRVRLRA